MNKQEPIQSPKKIVSINSFTTSKITHIYRKNVGILTLDIIYKMNSFLSIPFDSLDLTKVQGVVVPPQDLELVATLSPGRRGHTNS